MFFHHVARPLLSFSQYSFRPALIIFLTALILLSSGPPDAQASDLRPFTSDGCTLFPDGTIERRTMWCDCCFNHDIAYWQGGTAEERKKSDEALRDCVLERTQDRELAETMYLGVRAGGHPAFPAWYRWGYGSDYGRGYGALSDAEKERVRERLDEYQQKHPMGYCGEKGLKSAASAASQGKDGGGRDRNEEGSRGAPHH